jgi:hypothetical protein
MAREHSELDSARREWLTLDTAALSRAVVLVTEAATPGQYRGEVRREGVVTSDFTVSVVPEPAEPAVSIDCAMAYAGREFRVAHHGRVWVHVGSGTGRYSVLIRNDEDVLLDNSALRSGQLVVFRLVRPGRHLVEDRRNGGRCQVFVKRPEPGMPQDPPAASVKITGGTMTPDHVEVWPGVQPIVFTVEEGSHLVSSAFDPVDG